MKLDETIKKRCSTREFSSKKVKWADILEAIDSANQVPFAGNINNLKFLIISNQEKKDDIARQSQQLWISKAPYVVVVCSDTSRLEALYHERGLVYSRQQAGAAIQNLLLKLTDLKLSSCWVGAYTDDILKQILRIPGHFNIEAILPIGYGKGKPTKKARLETKIFWEDWGIKKKPSYF